MTEPSSNRDHATDAAPAARWKRVVGTLCGVALGGVLLVAAWAKLLDPEAFAGQIRAEGLDFLLSAEAVAMFALALEVGLGLALVLGLRQRWVLGAASLLVAFFLFLTGKAYYLAEHGLLEEVNSCGCFGNLVERTPAEAFWQDLALLVPLLLLAFIGRRPDRLRIPPVRTAVVAVGTLAALVFAAQAPELPLDDLATRLRPGVEVRDLCTGSEENRFCLPLVIPELEQGSHVVVLMELAGDGVDELGPSIEELNAYALRNTGPTLWVLSEVTPEQLNSFFWQWGPAFQIREAPGTLLRPLYRHLPRSFRVEDGRVTSTYPGLPPWAELADGSGPEGAGAVGGKSDSM